MELKIDGGHLIQLVELLVSAFKSGEAKRKSWKQDVFSREVLAVHQNMGIVHTNYLTILAELEERVLHAESSNVGTWIATVRAEHAFLRESLRAMDLPTPRFNDSDWIAAAHSFGQAVRDYFTLSFDNKLDPNTGGTRFEKRYEQRGDSTALCSLVEIATSLENADDPAAARKQFVGRVRKARRNLDLKLGAVQQAFARLKLATYSE